MRESGPVKRVTWTLLFRADITLIPGAILLHRGIWYLDSRLYGTYCEYVI